MPSRRLACPTRSVLRAMPASMTWSVLAAAILLAAGVSFGAPPQGVAPADGFDPERWTFESRDHRVEEYRGHTALLLDRGVAWLTGIDFGDGTIELDVAIPEAQAFAGLVFRDDGHGNHEHFYLRGHLSGKPDASQYNPVFHGVSGWQIYAGPRFNAPLELAHDRWMHLKLVVSGNRAAVYLDSDEPVLVIPELLHGNRSGRIGLKSTGVPARFANITVTPMEDPEIDGEGAEPEPVAETVVRSFRVSPPFAEEALEGRLHLDEAGIRDEGWSRLPVGERGIANLARTTGIDDGRNTVVAAVDIESDAERTIPARFGFSDRVRVYLNGRLLFAANDGWRTRDYRFLGTIGLHDTLYLPLHPGHNELAFAVSEGFGGWGVTLDLPERPGVTIHP